jgi:hypothetical protein
VFVARIVCSGRNCSEELELVVEDLDELEGFPCRCGYGFVLVEVGEVQPV